MWAGQGDQHCLWNYKSWSLERCAGKIESFSNSQKISEQSLFLFLGLFFQPPLPPQPQPSLSSRLLFSKKKSRLQISTTLEALLDEVGGWCNLPKIVVLSKWKNLQCYEGIRSKQPGLRSWGSWSGQQRCEGRRMSIKASPSRTQSTSRFLLMYAVQREKLQAQSRHSSRHPRSSAWVLQMGGYVHLYPGVSGLYIDRTSVVWGMPAQPANFLHSSDWLALLQPLGICKLILVLFFKCWANQKVTATQKGTVVD